MNDKRKRHLENPERDGVAYCGYTESGPTDRMVSVEGFTARRPCQRCWKAWQKAYEQRG